MGNLRCTEGAKGESRHREGTLYIYISFFGIFLFMSIYVLFYWHFNELMLFFFCFRPWDLGLRDVTTPHKTDRHTSLSGDNNCESLNGVVGWCQKPSLSLSLCVKLSVVLLVCVMFAPILSDSPCWLELMNKGTYSSCNTANYNLYLNQCEGRTYFLF